MKYNQRTSRHISFYNDYISMIRFRGSAHTLDVYREGKSISRWRGANMTLW